MTGRELQFGEQEIVDQGDGYVVYEAEGGEQFQIQVPKGWSPESNAMYKAVEKDGVFVLEADGAKAAVAGAAGGASAGLMEMLKRARGAAESDRFGEPDMPGQRSDNFSKGGDTRPNKYATSVNELLDVLGEMDSRNGYNDPESLKKFQNLMDDQSVRENIESIIGEGIGNMPTSMVVGYLLSAHKDNLDKRKQVADSWKNSRSLDDLKKHGDLLEHGKHIQGLASSMLGFEQGGRTYAGQYMGVVKEDEGGLYGEYETDSGEVIKAYFPSEYYPGDVGSSDYIKDRDFALVEQDGKKMWVPTSYGAGEENIAKAVMRESTQGASKVENLLERLSDVKRRSMGGKSYRYQ